MSKPSSPVGFDYANAIRALARKMTYEQIAKACGYDSRNSVYRVLNGAIPSHPQGEALFVLYREAFGDKPPMTQEQAAGEYVTQSDLDEGLTPSA